MDNQATLDICINPITEEINNQKKQEKKKSEEEEAIQVREETVKILLSIISKKDIWRYCNYCILKY